MIVLEYHFGSIRMDLVFENLKSRKVGQKNKFKPAAASSPLSLSLSLSFCPVERLNSPDVIAVQGKVRVPTLVVTVSKCEYIHCQMYICMVYPVVRSHHGLGV